MKNCFKLVLCLAIGFFTSCATEETEQEESTISYQMSISSSKSKIEENGGIANLTVKLDKINQGEAIPFELKTSSTATLDSDYEISETRVIENGQQSASITLSAIDDNEVEGEETIVITLQADQENLSISNASINLSILDNDSEQVAECSTSDTYSIDLDPTNCTIDIQNVLGVASIYEEEVSGKFRTINTNAIPNHDVGQFPNKGNPHTITEVNSTYSIAVNPEVNQDVTLLTNENGAPQYRFGVLYNGILLAPIAAEFFINTETGLDNTEWNENALSSEINLGTDCNNSHVFPSGMYHHHATPSAFIASMNIDGSSPVQIGWAADGYPIYYKYANKNGAVVALSSSYRLKTEERGGDGISAPNGCPDGTYTQDYEYVSSLGDLDECNGYQDPELGYIYVMTDTYPSIPRCFTATPSNDFGNK
ncbi:YHYH protein [Sediminitomix flava]|nr:YHYH protein [Sediminitomix flava]